MGENPPTFPSILAPPDYPNELANPFTVQDTVFDDDLIQPNGPYTAEQVAQAKEWNQLLANFIAMYEDTRAAIAAIGLNPDAPSSDNLSAALTLLKANADSKLASVVAGSGISVNNTDPQNPVLTATGGGGGGVVKGFNHGQVSYIQAQPGGAQASAVGFILSNPQPDVQDRVTITAHVDQFGNVLNAPQVIFTFVSQTQGQQYDDTGQGAVNVKVGQTAQDTWNNLIAAASDPQILMSDQQTSIADVLTVTYTVDQQQDFITITTVAESSIPNNLAAYSINFGLSEVQFLNPTGETYSGGQDGQQEQIIPFTFKFWLYDLGNGIVLGADSRNNEQESRGFVLSSAAVTSALAKVSGPDIVDLQASQIGSDQVTIRSGTTQKTYLAKTAILQPTQDAVVGVSVYSVEFDGIPYEMEVTKNV